MTGNPNVVAGDSIRRTQRAVLQSWIDWRVAARIYYSQHDRQNYRIRKLVNFDRSYPRLKMFSAEGRLMPSITWATRVQHQSRMSPASNAWRNSILVANRLVDSRSSCQLTHRAQATS